MPSTETTVSSVGRDNLKKIYYSADTILVGKIIGKEGQSQVLHNITNQEGVEPNDEGDV